MILANELLEVCRCDWNDIWQKLADAWRVLFYNSFVFFTCISYFSVVRMHLAKRQCFCWRISFFANIFLASTLPALINSSPATISPDSKNLRSDVGGGVFPWRFLPLRGKVSDVRSRAQLRPSVVLLKERSVCKGLTRLSNEVFSCIGASSNRQMMMFPELLVFLLIISQANWCCYLPFER